MIESIIKTETLIGNDPDGKPLEIKIILSKPDLSDPDWACWSEDCDDALYLIKVTHNGVDFFEDDAKTESDTISQFNHWVRDSRIFLKLPDNTESLT